MLLKASFVLATLVASVPSSLEYDTCLDCVKDNLGIDTINSGALAREAVRVYTLCLEQGSCTVADISRIRAAHPAFDIGESSRETLDTDKPRIKTGSEMETKPDLKKRMENDAGTDKKTEPKKRTTSEDLNNKGKEHKVTITKYIQVPVYVTKTQTKTDTKTDTKTQTKTETKTETKTQTKTQTQTKTDTKTQTQTQTKTETKTQTQTKTDTKTQTKTETKTVTTCEPPPIKTCELGTAFGYQEEDSVTLNTQSGTGCNRWGWYETPTLAELQAGISGILYVGAGGNNIANAIDVGQWTAVASPTGGVTVTYSLDAGYFVDEVHIDLDCLPIDSCTPGQYTFNSGALPNLPVYANPTPLQYPVCSGGSQAYLIVHASVNFLTSATTCPPPVAT